MKNKSAVVGIFVLAGLALFTLGLFLIGDRQQAFSRHVQYYAEFANLAGLAKGSKVRVAGVDAGQVTKIDVPSSPSKFRVAFRIDEKLRGLLRSDSLATLTTQGVVGDVYLSVRSGSSRGLPVAPFSTLPSKEPFDLSEVLAKGTGLLDDTDRAVRQVSSKLSVALDDTTKTVANVNDIVVGLKAGRGTAGMLLRDKALAASLKDNLTTTLGDVSAVVADIKDGHGTAGALLRNQELAIKVQGTVTNVEHASKQADLLLSALQSGHDSEKLDQVITNAQRVASNANAISAELHQIISEASEPDSSGISAGTNIRESLGNVNVATANLTDDTEALKHNFFLRSFFRQRGYYSVHHLSAEKYRRDSFFTSPRNFRSWIDAGELFQSDASGMEALSVAGKALLDSTMKQSQSLQSGDPIIVEGYSAGERAVDQVAFSRDRAVLVSRYLENRFHIDSADIGIVPLNHLPPAGVGRSSWNGVCIVVPRKS